MPSAMLLQPLDDVQELRHVDPVVQERLRELAAPTMPQQRLKRTGRRPFVFNGVTVATVCGITPALPFWYEINVHRTLRDAYVSDIRLFHNAADRTDLFWVAEHADLDACMDHLERYDPAGDIASPPEMLRPIAPAELAVRMARLQIEIDQVTQHYRVVVGELLSVLTPRG